jgi:hypothetical protein
MSLLLVNFGVRGLRVCTLLYRASKCDCDVCPLRARCCTKDAARKIPRDLPEDARDVASQKMKTKAFAIA